MSKKSDRDLVDSIFEVIVLPAVLVGIGVAVWKAFQPTPPVATAQPLNPINLTQQPGQPAQIL